MCDIEVAPSACNRATMVNKADGCTTEAAYSCDTSRRNESIPTNLSIVAFQEKQLLVLLFVFRSTLRLNCPSITSVANMLAQRNSSVNAR